MRKGGLIVVLFAILAVGLAFAGTGGAELTSAWDEITQGLQGFWGKLIAAVFVGLAVVALKGGQTIMAVTMFVIAMLIGAIPGIIDARYTLTFLSG